MENHFNIIKDRQGYCRIFPDNGFILVNTSTGMAHSEAIVKESELKNFVAKPCE